MRFLILTQYFEPEIGAPQVRLASMIRELRRRGHDVEVVTAFPNYPTGKIAPEFQGKVYEYSEWEGVPVRRLWLYASMGRGFARLLNYLSFTATCLIGLIRSKRPDYVFVESPPLTLGVPAIVISKVWGASVIFNVADLWPDFAREIGAITNPFVLRVAEWLEAWIYANSRYVCAVTEGIRERLITDKHVAPAKTLFLPNGVDTTFFRPDADDGSLKSELGLSGKKVVVYAGNLGYFQGLDLVLESLKQVQEANPELYFLFIGDGSDRPKLEALLASLALTNARILPASTPRFVARLYSIAYAGLVSLRNAPSAKISRPSKIWQVMASGRPVAYVGSGEGALLIEAAEAGVTVPAESSAAIAQMFLDLAADPERAVRLGENGRRVAQDSYSWEGLVGNWVDQVERDRASSSASKSPSLASKPVLKERSV